MIATTAAGLAVWLLGGAYRWNGYPSEHPGGVWMAALIALSMMACVFFIYRTLAADQAGSRVFYMCVLCWSLCRLMFCSCFPLGGDEAYHWQWSRRLDWCYYDHPGMVAWLARLCAPWGGHSAALIRLSPVLLGAGTAIATYQLARMTLKDERLATRAGVLFLLVPLFFASGLLMPMVAVTFFGVLGMTLLYRAMQRNRLWDWVVAGLALGAALNSNFTALLLIALGGLYLLLSRDHRRSLGTSGPYVALLVAGLCCVSLIVWNSKHEWVTLGFNLLRRHREMKFQFENIPTYLGILILMVSPLLGIRLLQFGVAQWQKAQRLGDTTALYLAIMGWGPILVFLVTASILKPRPHYAAAGLVPLLLLFVKECHERAKFGTKARGSYGTFPWVNSSARVAGAMCGLIPIVFLVPAMIPGPVAEDFLNRHNRPRVEKTIAELYGWPALARYIDRLGKFDRDTPTILIASSYAQASLIMTCAEHVNYAYSLDEGTIPYGQQFSIWGSLKNAPPGTNAVIFRSGRPTDLAADLARWRQKFKDIEVVPMHADKELENFRIYKASNSQVKDLSK